jgi:hypothetical protein
VGSRVAILAAVLTWEVLLLPASSAYPHPFFFPSQLRGPAGRLHGAMLAKSALAGQRPGPAGQPERAVFTRLIIASLSDEDATQDADRYAESERVEAREGGVALVVW